MRLETFSDPKRYPLVTAIVPHLRVSKLGVIFETGMDLIFQSMQDELAVAERSRKGSAQTAKAKAKAATD